MSDDDLWISSIVAIVALVLTLFVSLHVLWTRSDSRSSLAWIGLVWLVPFGGAFLYFSFGVNRIKRKASRVRALRRPVKRRDDEPHIEDLRELFPEAPQFLQLVRALDTVTSRPLCLGNHVEVLQNGDEAYPAMIEAIDNAKHSVAMLSYIFEARGPGRDFLRALVDAHKRGVEVRVLVDAAGERYGFPRISRLLKREGVTAARFLPAFPPWRWPFMNLRNHRKVLIVDGDTAFTGGLNIRPDHVLSDKPKLPTRDLHFRCTGPIAAQLMQVFAEDWYFVTSEHLDGEPFFFTKDSLPEGGVPARAIADGPDEDFDKVRWGLLAALACAQERVIVATPYFLPDDALVMALGVAARRGVQVDVILPERGNLAVVDWAMRHMLTHVDLSGVSVWRSTGDFDHTKLMVVDSAWVFLGSSNWDARSLRLNFELNVECYDQGFGKKMEALLDERIESAKPDSAGRTSILGTLRNAIAALFTPYL
ncbi:MAG: phospholipase D-like domain-containing protein [Polyangiales bacterium]